MITNDNLFKSAQDFRGMAKAGDAKISGDPNVKPGNSTTTNSQF